MIVTEAVARRKTCVSRHFAECCGAQCMAWEWWDPAEETTVEEVGFVPAGEGWATEAERPLPAIAASPRKVTWARAVPAERRRGYCGLVGGMNPGVGSWDEADDGPGAA